MTRKLTIEEMQKIAGSHGGNCLSKEYINVKTKLKWQCKEGHIWETTPDTIKRGSWCRKCSGSEKHTIELMHNLAKEKGGKCLSTNYFNAHTKLKWQCKESHIWEATPHKIKNRGQWCPYCIGKYQTIMDMKKIATERGGKCLSTEYITNKNNLKWQCLEGHLWEATPDNIKRGTWCPICATGISERICRQFFETIFNSKFPTKKPNWCVNSRGNLMHLDGFNEDLKLAFEYHGIQHFEFNPHFHNKNETFKQSKKDDEDKRNLCKLNDIVLIEVPYTVEYKKMQKYINEQYKIKTGLVLDNVLKIDYKKFNIYLFSKLEELNEIAKQREGKCLSTKYINAHTKLKWQCKEGHIWEATPDKIKQGSWCPKCAGNVRLTIEDMYKLAEENNGKCLSIEYINAHIKLRWQCKKRHVFKASANSVKIGHWCPKCAGNIKLTIEEMHGLAEKKGGKCLSIEYINAKTKLKWQCERSHIWMATPDNIKNGGQWCPTCKHRKIAKIE
ncbi:hypothetical protein LCGC14_1999660 [marine sediment metagenome]|uniref:Zinc-ribbon domain-containing protein n=1 Tax=marine sediment metagenome TaxID=412755 RepID=A0A0F9FRF2_9ZZZZ